MVTIEIYDKADELRIEIKGEFSGACVRDVSATWRASLPEAMHRRFTVDISEVSGCDTEGRNLLREMSRHGTRIAAGNPRALGLLNEITGSKKNRKTSYDTDPNTPRLSMARALHVSVASAS
jgi:hypothetical protein